MTVQITITEYGPQLPDAPFEIIDCLALINWSMEIVGYKTSAWEALNTARRTIAKEYQICARCYCQDTTTCEGDSLCDTNRCCDIEYDQYCNHLGV